MKMMTPSYYLGRQAILETEPINYMQHLLIYLLTILPYLKKEPLPQV
jgi:hypothetical protein